MSATLADRIRDAFYNMDCYVYSSQLTVLTVTEERQYTILSIT